MERIMTFQYISDTRFSNNPKVTLKEYRKKLIPALSPFAEIQVDPIREIPFGEPEPCISFRQRYHVKKKGGITWGKIMEIVNSIKAVYYSYHH